MPTFSGSLSLAKDHDSAVRADIIVDDERLFIEAGGEELGDWSLAEVVISPGADGFRLRADGEDLLLTTADDHAFAAAVGVRPPVDDAGPLLDDEPRRPKRRKAPRERRERRMPRILDRSNGRNSRPSGSWVAEETLRDEIAYLLLGAAALLIIGAALPWGEARLVAEDGFPWGRALTILSGLVAGVGGFLAWKQGQRIPGTATAAGAAGFALLVLYLFARAAGVGIGFLLAVIAIVPLGVAVTLGLTSLGMPDRRR